MPGLKRGKEEEQDEEEDNKQDERWADWGVKG